MNHLLHRVDRSQHVAHMGECDKAGVLGEHILVSLKVQLTVIADGNGTDADALATSDELPRHDVAVVLHDGEDDLIAMLQHVAQRRRHQVDAFSSATCEDDFFDALGVDVLSHLFARRLDEVGSLLRKGVHATMYIGLVTMVHFVDDPYHAVRCERCGCIVQIDQWSPLDCAPQDGIFAAYFV